jgi:sporulation protein YlmC with PRC-barrel domain
MSILLRAGELTGRPVVTLGGERIAEVKDVVFDRGAGSVAGFTLNNHGLFSRSRKDALPWSGVHGLGSDAVMIRVEEVLVPVDEVAPKAERRNGDVLSGAVLTETGQEIGTVTDVILQVGPGPTSDSSESGTSEREFMTAEVVGYEIEAGQQMRSPGRRVYIPVPATRAVSGERLVVPATVTDFVADDLAGFGAAVDAFRARLASDGGA